MRDDDAGMESGTMKFFLPDRHFGIVAADAGDDLYVPENAYDGEIPKRGARVTFVRKRSRRRVGAFVAFGVRVVRPN